MLKGNNKFENISTTEANTGYDYACGKSLNGLAAWAAARGDTDPPTWEEYYGTSTEQFSTIFKDRRDACIAAANAAAKEASESMVETREFNRPENKSRADESEQGNSHVSLWHDYDFFYDFADVEQLLRGNILNGDAITDPDPSAEEILNQPFNLNLGAVLHGYFKAGVDLFGKKVELVATDGYININWTGDTLSSDYNVDVETTTQVSEHGDFTNTDKAAGFFEFGGYNFWDDQWGVSSGDDGNYDSSGGEKQTTIFEASTRFQVGPIPMSLTVGVSGGMGIDFGPELNAKLPAGLSGDEALTLEEISDSEVRLSAGLMVTPYASLEAFAQLAIDLVVLSAGVEIEITIINVSLPFTAALAFNFALEFPNSTNAENLLDSIESGEYIAGAESGGLSISGGVSFDTNLDLVLRTLDGRISLFAKVDLFFWEKTYRKTIADWSGFEFGTNIFNFSSELGGELDYTVPLRLWNTSEILNEIDLDDYTIPSPPSDEG